MQFSLGLRAVVVTYIHFEVNHIPFASVIYDAGSVESVQVVERGSAQGDEGDKKNENIHCHA